MRIDCAFAPAEMPVDLRDTAVVVIDVLRATTTIAYALRNGARSVVPCEEPQDALALRERIGARHVVLGGERNSIRITGFDLDNSPASYTRERVEGKTVAFTTTNGTRALGRAMQASAPVILCGAFVNLSAIVQHVQRMHPPRVLLACAGSEGALTLEDVLAAGAIALRLQKYDPHVELSDGAKAAALAYGGAAQDLHAAIASSDHAQSLMRAGFAGDIGLAAQIDAAAVLPVLENGEIVEGHSPAGR